MVHSVVYEYTSGLLAESDRHRVHINVDKAKMMVFGIRTEDASVYA